MEREENQQVEIIEQAEQTYPLVALRGKVLFPKTLLNFEVGRPASIEAINRAVLDNSQIFIASQKNAFIDTPQKKDILRTGVVARIKQVVKVQNGNNMKVSVEALYRAKIINFVESKPCFIVTAMECPYIMPENELEVEAYFRIAKNCFFEYASTDKRINKDMISAIMAIQNVNEFMDNAVSILALKEESAQEILETDDTLLRLKAFERLCDRELEIAKIERSITGKVRQSIDKSQKEFYLREQLKAIHDELGEGEDEKEVLIKEFSRVYSELLKTGTIKTRVNCEKFVEAKEFINNRLYDIKWETRCRERLF